MIIKRPRSVMGLSGWLVMSTVKAWSGELEAQRRRRRCRVLSVDETANQGLGPFIELWHQQELTESSYPSSTPPWTGPPRSSTTTTPVP